MLDEGPPGMASRPSLRLMQADALEHQWRMSNEPYSVIRNEDLGKRRPVC